MLIKDKINLDDMDTLLNENIHGILFSGLAGSSQILGIGYFSIFFSMFEFQTFGYRLKDYHKRDWNWANSRLGIVKYSKIPISMNTYFLSQIRPNKVLGKVSQIG